MTGTPTGATSGSTQDCSFQLDNCWNNGWPYATTTYYMNTGSYPCLCSDDTAAYVTTGDYSAGAQPDTWTCSNNTLELVTSGRVFSYDPALDEFTFVANSRVFDNTGRPSPGPRSTV